MIQFPQGFTFADVSLVPNHSQILPSDVSTNLRLSDAICLRTPILSAAMDTVTTAPMAIAMAQAGGLGIIHKNMSIEQQAAEVLKVKNGELYCGAAVGPGKDLKDRVYALVNAGADVLAVDSAHGHSRNVYDAVFSIRKWFPKILIIAGNVVTKEGALFLYEAGADVIKVGVGPGTICTTRVIAGVGIPQLSAILDVGSVAKNYGFKVIADGGIQFSGDITKALAAGAHGVMTGSLLAGAKEAPGEKVTLQGKEYKVYRGMGSVDAMKKGAKDRYGQEGVEESNKLVPEGIEGCVPCKKEVSKIIYQLVGGLRSGMGYLGAINIDELHEKARFVIVSAAGFKEGHAHDIMITKESPNYIK